MYRSSKTVIVYCATRGGVNIKMRWPCLSVKVSSAQGVCVQRFAVPGLE